MFDIATTDTKTPSEKGAFLALISPVTGLPLVDDEGEKVGVTLRGRYSDACILARKTNANIRLERAAAQQPLPDDVEETALLVAHCTVSWTWTDLDGKPFPCSPENAMKFWNDPRFRFHLDRAVVFISDLGNFTTR